MCSFCSDLDWKYPFWANLVQKMKIVRLSWNLVPRLIWICRIQSHVEFTFSVFGWECSFEVDFILEAEVWQLVISNMQNSCRSLFSNFDEIYSFWVNLVQKIKRVSVNCNLVYRLIWMWRIYRVCSFCSDLDWKYPFWANLVQKMKIVRLSWNLVPRLIWICRIQSHVEFTFSVCDWECSFEVNFILEAEVCYLVISNMYNSCRSLFSNFHEIYSF